MRGLRTLLICLASIVGSNNQSCLSNDYPYIDYQINDTQRSSSDERNVRTCISLCHGAGSYEYDEFVRGSLAPNAADIIHMNSQQRTIGVKDSRDLCNRFTQSDFFNLMSDPPMTKNEYVPSDYYEMFTYEDGVKKQLFFCTRPRTAARKKLRDTMIDFAKRTRIDQPPFKYDSTICTEGDRITPREVELKELLVRQEQYHGKRVSVRGFYRWEYEGSELGIDEQARTKHQFDRCVWIGEPSSFANIQPLEQVGGAWVRIEGVFLKGPGGHMGLSAGEINRITRFDVEQPFPRPITDGIQAAQVVNNFILTKLADFKSVLQRLTSLFLIQKKCIRQTGYFVYGMTTLERCAGNPQ